MKELLKQIIFEQQDNCRHLMQDAIPRHIEEEWLTTSEILIITGVRPVSYTHLDVYKRQDRFGTWF